MSMLKCWFWKKKKKQSNDDYDYSKNEPKLVYAVPHVVSTYDFKRLNKSQRRNSDSFTYENTYKTPKTYIKRVTKSYPTSPVKAKHGQNCQDIPYKHSVPMVYVAKMPGSSTLRVSQSPPAPVREPFPFEIPKPEDTLPRRSSLFYGVRNSNVNELPDNCKWTAKNPVEDCPPHTSSVKQEYIPEKHVTIKLPDNSEEFNVMEPVKRTTIIRLRPSSVSQSPGEYVKQMTVRASTTEPQPLTLGKHVHTMAVRPSNDSPVLITGAGKKLKPLGTNKIRTSITKDPQRSSVVRQSFTHDNGLRTSELTNQGLESVVYPVPVMHAKRNSVIREEGRKSITREEHNLNERRDSVRGRDELSFPLNTNNPSPMVYAVPTVPTRGRTRSILHQSVKSFTSKDSADLSAINKKNLRRSMDTDVFSSHSQRRSIQKNQPGLINMERGKTVLVSELLNPISSIFVSDLKDAVPKDPLTKPREYNNLVTPRRQSVQTIMPKKQQTTPERKLSTKAPVVYQNARSNQQRSGRYKSDSSSSEESIEVYRKKSKRSHPSQNKYVVYSTQVKPIVLPLANKTPQNAKETGKNPPFKKKGKPLDLNTTSSSNNDFCGLDVEHAGTYHPSTTSRPKMVSSAQQTDIDDEMDLLCYPADRLPSETPLTTESGSKLRWRIIIKR